MKRLTAFLQHPRVLLTLYFAAAIIAAIQYHSLGTHAYATPKYDSTTWHPIYNRDTLARFDGLRFTDYNNYVIFRQAHHHLLQHKDLYILYPTEQWDLYKYSPAFALLFAPLAYLPDLPGLMLWNLINALAFYFAVWKLPLKRRARSFILLFSLLELFGSLQNFQSNGLLAALLIAAVNAFEKKKLAWAALAIAGATFIKVYGAIGFAFLLFYPGKARFISWSALWMLLFAALPLVATSPDGLLAQYASWGRMLRADTATSYGLSVMGWLHTWFGIGKGAELPVLIFGVLCFCAPLLRMPLWKDPHFRLRFLAQTLLWMVVFNPKAESPTYNIAVTGAALWYAAGPRSAWRTALLLCVFVFTCLSPTDIFPGVAKEFFGSYAVKAVPCIAVWAACVWDLLRMKSSAEKATGKVSVATSEPSQLA